MRFYKGAVTYSDFKNMSFMEIEYLVDQAHQLAKKEAQ